MSTRAPCPRYPSERIERLTEEGFLEALRRRAHPLDVVGLAALPVLLVAVHELSGAAGVFRTEAPTLSSAYLTTVHHYDRAHLLGNLAGYLLVVPTAYVLSVLSDRRKHFWATAVVLVGGLPLLLAGAHILRSEPVAVVGFSGVMMGFVGYLSLILVGYVATRFSAAAHLDHAPLVFFAGMAVVAAAVLPSAPASLLVAAVVAAAVAAYLYAAVRDLPSPRAVVAAFRANTGRPGYAEAALLGAVSLAGTFALGFFGDPAADGTAVSLFSHLVGYGAGFIVAYAVLRTDCSVTRVRDCATDDSDCEVHDSPAARLFRRAVVGLLGDC